MHNIRHSLADIIDHYMLSYHIQGDLGAIDEKYDVAISTACGSLDHIVVDSINTAQSCVEFLKKNNIGSATFIGLDKMAKWKDHCKRTITTYVNIDMCVSVIQVIVIKSACS